MVLFTGYDTSYLDPLPSRTILIVWKMIARSKNRFMFFM